MKKIDVSQRHECPFQSEHEIALSEVTWDTETVCGLKDDGECYGSCPLKEEGIITVQWIVIPKEQTDESD